MIRSILSAALLVAAGTAQAQELPWCAVNPTASNWNDGAGNRCANLAEADRYFPEAILISAYGAHAEELAESGPGAIFPGNDVNGDDNDPSARVTEVGWGFALTNANLALGELHAACAQGGTTAQRDCISFAQWQEAITEFAVGALGYAAAPSTLVPHGSGWKRVFTETRAAWPALWPAPTTARALNARLIADLDGGAGHSRWATAYLPGPVTGDSQCSSKTCDTALRDEAERQALYSLVMAPVPAGDRVVTTQNGAQCQYVPVCIE